MANDVGNIYYTVDARTDGLLAGQRQVDASTRKMERSLGRGEAASKRLGSSFDSAGSSGLKLKNIVTSITAALSARQIIDYSDAWTRTQNQLRQVTSSSAELADVNRQLLEISNRSAISIEGTSELYTKLARATKDLGLQQDALTSFVDLTAKSLRANGASAAGASALILQLSQSFNSGILQGEEFNTIMDQSPLLLEALQKSTGKTTRELKKLGSDGKLSVVALVKAVLDYSDTINQRASVATNSFSDNLTTARNNMISFVGASDSAQGVIGDLGEGIVYLSNNLDVVTQGAIAFSAVIAGRYASALSAGAIAHISMAAAAVRNAAATREAALAANAAASADVRRAEASVAAVRSTIAEIAADREALAATLATNQAQGVQVAIKRQLAEMDTALAAAKARLATQERNLAIATTQETVAHQANAAAISRSSTVALVATRVMGGLRAVMSLLGGPVGVILLAAQALYTFREQLGLTSSDATSTQRALRKLKDEMQDMTDVELNKTLTELQQQLIATQDGIKNTENRIDQMVKSGEQDFGGQSIGDLRNQLQNLREDAKQTQASIDAIKDLRKPAAEQAGGKPAVPDIPDVADDSAAKQLQAQFAKVKKELATQREDIEREYQERNKVIAEATAAGSDQQAALLARSDDKRKRDLQSLNDQLAAINATGLERINQQYDTQRQQILDITEKGSDQQTQALTRNEAERLRALQSYQDQELGDLRSQTDQVVAEYQARKQKIFEVTEKGSQQQRDALARLDQQQQVDLLNAQAQELLMTQNHQQALLEAEQAMYAARLQAQDGWTAEAAAKLAEFQTNAADPAKYLTDSLQNAFVNLDDTIATTFTNGIRQGESFGEIMTNVGRSIVAELLQSVIKLGVQMAINAALGNTYAAASAATAAATGASMAAAYAPAAAMASLASFGANAIPAAAALTSTTALASTMALAGGRQYGGNVNAGSLYRVTEDGKPEMYTDGTQSYLLPGRNGKVTANKDMGSGSTVVQPVIQLIGQGADKATVSQKQGSDGQTITQIILADMQSDGPISSGMKTKFGLSSRGT